MTATHSEYQDEEIEFMMLGLVAFFDTDIDKNMDWEDFFSLK